VVRPPRADGRKLGFAIENLNLTLLPDSRPPAN
jgi:hypothetical protein